MTIHTNHTVRSIVLFFIILTTNNFLKTNWPRTPQQNALLLVCTVLEYEHKEQQTQNTYTLFLQQIQTGIHKKSYPITRSAIRRAIQKVDNNILFESEDTQKHLRKEFIKKLPIFFGVCTQQDFENAYDYMTEYKPYPQGKPTKFYYKKALESIESHEESEPILPVISLIPTTSRQSSKANATTTTSCKLPKITD
jgi:hypothetical protein